MQEFFHMGGYAFYVWTSYGLAFIVLLLNFVLPIQQEKQILRNLARKFKRNRHDNTQQKT
jgi:heme exporter protein D